MRGLVYSVLRRRASVRWYAGGEVGRDVVERLVEAATWAPSAHNAQPWRFVAVFSRGVKERLARLMGERWFRDLVGDGVSADRARAMVEESVKRITGAPVVIVVALTMRDMDRYPDEKRSRAEFLMAVQSVAAAIENLLIAAEAEGLGACWMCAPLFAPEEVRCVLRLPDDFEPQALITLGVPAEKPEKPPRKPLREVLRFDTWC